MSVQPVHEALRNVLADVFDIPCDDVTPELAVGSIEKWDSFGHLQAILALEAEFGVQFDPQRISQLTTVALLQAELKEKGIPA
jgi:acyl carrier protein